MIKTTVADGILIPERPRIAVLPMELSGYPDEDIAVIRQNWRNMVEAGLIKSSFRVVDRDVVDSILQEQHFQKSGVVNRQTSVDLGKILGINYVVVGTVRVASSDGSQFHIQLRIVDVQSGELVAITMATGDAGVGYLAADHLSEKLRALFVSPAKTPSH
jgi:TolB-like protein